MVWRGRRDLDVGISAGAQRLGGDEVDEAVLSRAAGKDGRILLARSRDEDFLGSTDPSLVGGEGAALDDDA